MGWLRSIATNEKVSSDNELTEFVSDALACTERALSSLNALSSTLQLEVRKASARACLCIARPSSEEGSCGIHAWQSTQSGWHKVSTALIH
eukprot:762890-Pleurochrysis_carterae.AAC.7